ncbi:MAG: glycoside hydrolase family 3 C-terminal domain-containing protein [Candidatus Acidiferrales bacterium]
MTYCGKRKLLALIACIALLACAASAQEVSKLPYMNPKLPTEERAADLVHRMTLPEKTSQLVNQARAIPRLGVPAYNWWSEALHGVMVNGTTEFPEPIGLAATFDEPGIHEMATAIGIEGRIVHAQSVHDGNSTIFHGLDFWAPNVNIFRDPRWGRGQETYGEDPFLDARMAVAFVTGMQGTDPHYYQVISSPKHFDAHSGPEPIRHFADYDVSKHDLEDTYLPAFRAAIVEGHAGSIMCAYTGLKGEPDCANQFLLQDTLRGAWQFQGYVVSDCDAVRDIFSGHHYRPTQAQSSAISLERGMDNECADFFTKTTDDHDYKPFIEAVQQGYLSESAINTALVRLFTARIKLGMFDPPSMVPYDHIDPSQLNSAAHRELARRIADESMVLLKNDGVLPLKPSVERIAIVGPLADQTAVLLGNYNGIPTHTVSMLEGMKAEFPNAKITYVPGTQFLSNGGGKPVPASALTTRNGKPGLDASYSSGAALGQESNPITSRVEASVDLNENNLPEQVKGKSAFTVQWTGFLNAPETGEYLVGIRAAGVARVSLNDRQIAQTSGRGSKSTQVQLGRVHLVKGQPAKLDVTYGEMRGGKPAAQLEWVPVNNAPDPAAVAAARNADVVIAVVGLTSRLEGEEMQVEQPGFLGGDRTNLKMPGPEEALVQAVAATGKPLVVVLMNGSALAVNWEKAHANAILEAWYSGEEGGAAIADTLSGKNNPGGRLPVTFYQNINQLPNFEDYSMKGRTYRYFDGQPLWPFGYGLSYTTFKYSDLTVPSAPINAGDPLNVSATVTNTGKLAGDEVAELYLKFPDVPGAPIRALRGFQRIHLEPGASQEVKFHLKRRDLSMVTDAGDIIVAQGQYTVSVGGGQPGTGVASVSSHFEVNGQIMLPE